MENPLVAVRKFGQSIWYDNIRRSLITSGDLKAMVDHDGLLGMTSNPAIFEKALTGSDDYDQPMRALVEQGVGSALDMYERLAIQDIQMAADVLSDVYQKTDSKDGYVSLEVSPYLAHDTDGTLEEARRLHKMVDRANVMIKVPATKAGVPAVTQLIGEGININVTLLFAVEAYEAVADAYLTGLEKLAANGGDLSKVSSVASFFISRIDALIDEKLGRAVEAAHNPEQKAKIEDLLGKVAIANAKIAYAVYKDLTAGERWKALEAQGARPQRLLWASTSTKNPSYPKTMYVDELIGPDTVNTMPGETFEAFRDVGQPESKLTNNWPENLAGARTIIQTLADVDISLEQATEQLLDEAVRKFVEPFDALLSSIERKRQTMLGADLAQQTYSLNSASDLVAASLKDWRASGKIRRLWHGDTALWSSTDEDQWLGWLHIVDEQRSNGSHLTQIAQLAKEIQQGDFQHVLLLGMGGSSLCPEVMRRTFGVIDGCPELLVLDSTVPAQVEMVAQKIDPSKTLFIVSSKSGGTTEPNVFKQYFFDKVRQAIGADRAGSRFIAITDPGSALQQLAERDQFRAVFPGVPSIGGRYSALSNFGMIPAAVMGVDVSRFLDSTVLMVQSCSASVPPEVNPGATLGAIMGTLAKQGRDKVTIITSPGIRALGAWLEQLIAESTGKEGTGLIPIDDEQIGSPAVYGNDRLFVYLRLNAAPSAEQAEQAERDSAVTALEKAGQPVVRIRLEEIMDLGQEFFRWEMATAVAGSIFGINAFNQPDVEASKIATRKLTAAYEETGQLPDETPFVEDRGLRFFSDPKNVAALQAAASGHDAVACLGAHLGRIQAGDYFGINAYVEMNEANQQELQAIRHAVRDTKQVATTLGYGPRFLHSTGQLHKGGPNTGVFLQITSDDAQDLSIPGQRYSFGTLKRFQAQGDFEVLAERGRRALRVHLGADVQAGLQTLREAIASTLV